MGNILELRNVTFTYKYRQEASITDVSLQVEAGDFLLLTGPTGCGKSTLLKTLNGLIPHESGGSLTGQVLVGGTDTQGCSIAQLSRMVGMVFQSPDDQIFSTTVFDETAFILENMGLSGDEICLRAEEALAWVGLPEKRNASVHTLSGGQKQRLALASVLAAKPRILALDEPISQLDPQGADALLSVLRSVNQILGTTVIIVEHRLHEVMPLCRKVAIMDRGRLIWQGSRQEAYRQPELFQALGLRLPQTVSICRQLDVTPRSESIADAAAAIRRQYHISVWEKQEHSAAVHRDEPSVSPAVQVENLSFRYTPGKGPLILDDINLTIPQGKFIMLMGNNGAGKSTLLHLIGGLLAPQHGCIRVLAEKSRGISAKVGMVLQNPDFMLFNPTVRREIAFAPGKREVWTPACQLLSEHLGLTEMANDFPLALSRGQRLRVAIAAVLARRPEVLLLDEPTTGQDIGHIEDIASLLQDFTRQGGTIIFCTHDTEVASRYGDQVIVMSRGRVLAQAPPREIFLQDELTRDAGLKPPAAMLMARALFGGTALTVKEVVDYVRQGCMGSRAEKHTGT